MCIIQIAKVQPGLKGECVQLSCRLLREHLLHRDTARAEAHHCTTHPLLVYSFISYGFTSRMYIQID